MPAFKNRTSIATAIAIVFHAAGLCGMIVYDTEFFASLTPWNMLLMFLLLIWTQPGKNNHFLLFAAACVVAGFGVEVLGIHTQLLFGDYAYGDTLGRKALGVPLIIGINWCIVISGCGATVQALYQRVMKTLPPEAVASFGKWKRISLVIDGALLAVCFDWVLEPVAVQLGYWSWTGGSIPFFNYLCWFAVSSVLLWFFFAGKFNRNNTFAMHLLMIEILFFLFLRTFL
ncbi:MAG: carotenoid biosynthesis protein [Chitinophagaceae bacterium]|nr:carotenoid biosynthesis protein [Chitinophagaceae bacterium]MCW5928814.1 carotenoid biosynthesis protein [Chitinophagaceae bacterium]